MIICTSVCAAQSAEAVILAQSVKRHIPDCKFLVCLVEKEPLPDLENEDAIDELILGESIGIENFGSFIKKYTPSEAASLCTAPLLDFVYKKYEDERLFIYLTPTIKVFSSFPEIEKAFERDSILFAGHLHSPQSIEQVIWEDNTEVELLRIGVLNESIIGIRRSRSAGHFLSWWRERVMYSMFFDPITGFCSSQKWLTSALTLFDEIFLLKHPGYNVAYWNLGERKLSAQGNTFSVNRELLRCFNFSELKRIESYCNKDRTLHQLINSYTEELNRYRIHFPEQTVKSHHHPRRRQRRRR